MKTPPKTYATMLREWNAARREVDALEKRKRQLEAEIETIEDRMSTIEDNLDDVAGAFERPFRIAVEGDCLELWGHLGELEIERVDDPHFATRLLGQHPAAIPTTHPALEACPGDIPDWECADVVEHAGNWEVG